MLTITIRPPTHVQFTNEEYYGYLVLICFVILILIITIIILSTCLYKKRNYHSHYYIPDKDMESKI